MFVYKVFVVNTEPRLHFGAQCNVNVGSSGAGLERLGLVLGLMGALFGCKRVWSVWLSGSNYMVMMGYAYLTIKL